MVGTIVPTSIVGDALLDLDVTGDGTSRVVAYTPDFWTEHALREVYSTYGDVVDVKPKSLHKFGENQLVGTSEATLMTLPAGVLSETYVSTNAITHLSSSSAADTQLVAVEGHTISAGLFTFVTQTATLTGQTKVALTTPLARISRIANLGSTGFAGSVYGFEDDTLTAGVPNTAAKVHITVTAAENQSLKASTTISNADYEFITDIYASVEKKTAAGAVVRFKVRNAGGVFRTQFKLGLNSVGPDVRMTFRPYLIIPQNSDVLMTAEADGASTEISGGWNSLLATVRADN